VGFNSGFKGLMRDFQVGTSLNISSRYSSGCCVCSI